jgi:hypoxanthine phosphoribosyltransferase
MEQDLARILIDRERIGRRVRELAASISATYATHAEGLVIVPILAGSIIFVADLIRCLPFKMKIGLMTVSRYRGNTTSGGETQFIQDISVDVRGRHVLIVDDILDSGTTIRAVSERLRRQNPASLRACVLLRKTAKAPKDLAVDFVGFDIEDAFVVGYGLDYDGQYRNLPDIAVLRPECYR